MLKCGSFDSYALQLDVVYNYHVACEKHGYRITERMTFLKVWV